MPVSRRVLVKGLCGLPVYASSTRNLAAMAEGSELLPAAGPESGPSALPDKRSFPFAGTYLDAAFTHPLGVQGFAAGQAYFLSRRDDPNRRWPGDNPRRAAVALFAELIHAEAVEVAVVPSTMEGENMVGAALGLGAQAGVVTDAFHYDASLAMYGELQRGGVPVAVVKPRDNRIDLEDFDAQIAKGTRLVAVSLVSSITGYQHDLKKLCEIAHAKGALVYADIVQAAGAVPIDVKASGVDFCCCGTYKWLMGDFGVAFLYVRPDRLDQLRRVHYGWRDFSGEAQHVYPFDAPGPAIGDWKLGTSTVSHFEAGTPDWCALAVAVASLGYIRALGVEAIERHRQPLLERLQRELPKLGFLPLTPAESTGPIVSFALKGAEERLKAGLEQAKVQISLYENRIRISPSVYNDMDDVERLIRALSV